MLYEPEDLDTVYQLVRGLEIQVARDKDMIVVPKDQATLCLVRNKGA